MSTATFTTTSVAQSLPAGEPIEKYGFNNKILSDLVQRTANSTSSVEVIDVFNEEPDITTTNVSSASHNTQRRTFSGFDSLNAFLSTEVPKEQTLRILTVKKLSGPVLQLLGSKYKMDYELWTNRFESSDREWFAGPHVHRGAREFIHFNLSCVEFLRAKESTPEKYLANQKIGHTVRLMRFLDRPQEDPTQDRRNPRLFAIRRISGHLRLDGNLWTFIFFTDPYIDVPGLNGAQDTPGHLLSPFDTWLSEYVRDDTPSELINDLGRDGFGLVLKVLRDMKTSWKLLLNEMEVFLESLTDEYSDKQLMDSATWLHRTFIMNLDYCSRQLLYQQRFVTYLTNHPSQKGLCIAPSVYAQDLLQEKDALIVVVQRLKAIRERTISILKTVLSLHAAHQAQLASEMTALQRQDAAMAVRQNNAIRRLTFVNMAYLPPSFIAGVYGMNVAQNSDSTSLWSLWSFLGVATFLTIGTLLTAHVFSVAQTGEGNIAAAKGKAITEKYSEVAIPQSSSTDSMYHRFLVLLGSRRRKRSPGADMI